MICNKQNCTGCFACYNICPKNAIKMVEDSNGFIYPEIDREKCMNCKLCEKRCPALNEVEQYKKQKCYAMHSIDEKIRDKSTSGGVATTFSINIIKNGGVVYGAAYDKNCTVNHIRVTEVNELKKLQGSKYVHSYINNTYKNIKEDLKNSREVLFVGTPCQVAGLKKYLGKDYEKLILVDIICHGVPSQKYLKDEVNRINKNLNVDRVNFRNGNQYGFFILKKDEVIYGIDKEKSPYSDAFMQTLSLRENCYKCKYSGHDRISDITIGDFWGLDKSSKFYNERQKGVSTVIISTDKGHEFLKKCKDDMYIEEREYIEAVNGNTQLRTPAPKNKNADKFKSDYLKYGFKKAYKKNTRLIRANRKLRKIKNILKKRS